MKKWILTLVIAATVFGFAGFLIGKSAAKGNVLNFSIKAIRAPKVGLTDPLVDYEIDSGLYTKTLQLFRDDIKRMTDEKIQQKKADNISVYFRSLTNGPWFGINQDRDFVPASLLKVPIMITYYKWAEDDPSVLKKEIKYDTNLFNTLGDFNNSQYFKTQSPIEVGKTYTVEDLIEKMIVNSDNNAKNLLVLNLDNPERLFRVYTDLGISTPPELRGTGDIVSAHEYSTFFRVLYNASYLSKDSSEKALELLTQANFKDGLVAELPADIKIAHKFGEYEDTNSQTKELHDCGIVYYPSYPYIICVMTKGKNMEDLKKAVQDISSTAYKEIDKQIKRGENN